MSDGGRMMSDWNPGDRFKLECEGKVNKRGSNWIEVDLGSPLGRVSFGFPGWFAAHATKIKPFRFGDLVWYTDGTGLDYKGVVVDPNVSSRGYIEVLLPKKTGRAVTDENGHLHSSTLNVKNLTLIEPAEAT